MWIALLISAAVLAALELRAQRSGSTRLIYVLKPLTTACIVLIAAFSPTPLSTLYQTAIVLGLLFSLAGDVFLMLPRDRFLAGLASFLVAHVCYLAAFVSASGLPRTVGALLVLIGYGVYLLKRLWARLGKYRGPVTLYATVLLLMAAGAYNQLMQFGDRRAFAALAGAILFVISDSALALDRFELGAKRRQTLVLATYFSAQWLIAFSVRA